MNAYVKLPKNQKWSAPGSAVQEKASAFDPIPQSIKINNKYHAI